MTKSKLRLITIISFFALFALTFGLALGVLFPVRKAYARTYAVTTIFSEGTGGKVVASEKVGDDSYIQFNIDEGGNVYYRRDLALRWFEAGAKNAEKTAPFYEKLASPAAERYLSMTFAFGKFNFDSFTIKFEGAEENISKDAKSVNSIRFAVKTVQEGDQSVDKLMVAIIGAKEQELKDEDLDFKELGEIANFTGDITLNLSAGDNAGEFAVKLNGPKEVTGKFTNIGSNFLEYRASTATTPNTPITFTADLPVSQEQTGSAEFLMKELNGQKFKLDENKNVVDNAPAVLVLNEAVYTYTLGRRFSLTYEAIDVCDDSVSVTRNYYMAQKEAPETDDGDGEASGAAEDERPYHKPADDDTDYKLLSTTTYFISTDDDRDEEYVSIRFRLDDGTTHFYKCDKCGRIYDNNKEAKRYEALTSEYTCPGPNGDGCPGGGKKGDLKAQNYYVNLAWYAANENVVVTLNEEDAGNAFDCIKVNRDKEGPMYVGLNVSGGTNDDTDKDFQDAIEEYQKKVKEIAEDTNAGNGAYFYLPSLRELISSDYADYRNLRFSIYYRKGRSSSTQSATALRYNALRFEITTPELYSFRVIASDAAGNAMKMYNQDGKLVDVTGSNVWDIEGIPEFYFEVGYTGATVKEQKNSQTGYLDSTYTISSFDIVAVPGYETEYTLYRFDANKLGAGESIPNYDDLWKKPEEYFTKYYKEGEEGGALIEISAYNSDIDEDDEHWDDTDNDYAWNPKASSLSFVPQVATYYFVKLVLTEHDYAVGNTVTAYQVIRVNNPIDTVTAKSNWLQNNVTSVVLFSISAVLAVAIIVLFVVKPSDKKVEEVDLSKLKGGKKDKKEKK